MLCRKMATMNITKAMGINTQSLILGSNTRRSETLLIVVHHKKGFGLKKKG